MDKLRPDTLTAFCTDLILSICCLLPSQGATGRGIPETGQTSKN